MLIYKLIYFAYLVELAIFCLMCVPFPYYIRKLVLKLTHLLNAEKFMINKILLVLKSAVLLHSIKQTYYFSSLIDQKKHIYMMSNIVLSNISLEEHFRHSNLFEAQRNMYLTGVSFLLQMLILVFGNNIKKLIGVQEEKAKLKKEMAKKAN